VAEKARQAQNPITAGLGLSLAKTENVSPCSPTVKTDNVVSRNIPQPIREMNSSLKKYFSNPGKRRRHQGLRKRA